MNRKSSPANNMLRLLGGLIFLAILAVNAIDQPGIERIVVPLIVLGAVGISVLRLVSGLSGRQASGGAASADTTRTMTLVMVVVGLMAAGAAFYFMLGRRGGVTALPEVFRWAPLSGALEAVSQWGVLLIVGGLVGVIAVVALTIFLRRAGELPGSRSNADPAPWDRDNPS